MRAWKGFSLVELMVVVAIIAVLAGVGATIYSGSREKANDGRRAADIKAVSNALEFNRDYETGIYPTLSPNFFSNQKIPSPPEGGSYPTPIMDADNKGYLICAPLSNNSGGACSLSDTTCYCIQSRGGAIIASSNFSAPIPTAGPTSTPAAGPSPTAVNTPTPTFTPTPTPACSLCQTNYGYSSYGSCTPNVSQCNSSGGTSFGTSGCPGSPYKYCCCK